MTDGPARSPCGRARRRLATVLTLAFLPGFLAACASAGSGPARGTETVDLLPARTGFDAGDFTNQPSSVRDTVLEEPRQRIWAALPYVFRALGVETTTLDARSYVIGNEGWRTSALHGTRLSSFLECGRGIVGPNADNYDVTMQLLVQLEPRGANATLVRTVMDAYARPRSASGNAIHCATQGTLEGRIVRLLAEGMTMEGEGGLVTSGGTLSGSPGLARGPVGRLPAAGDFVRVGCTASAGGEMRVTEGSFLGASGGALMLELGPQSQEASVPAASVASLQIRERRSRTRIGAVALALVGGAAGAHLGRQRYDPDGRLHYGPGAFAAIGGVLGGIGGALVGALAGSLIDYDVWVDVTPSWHARFGGAPGGVQSALDAAACPSF